MNKSCVTETDRLWCGTEMDLVAGPEDVLGQRLGVFPARHGVAVLGPVDDLVPFQAPREVVQRRDLLVLHNNTTGTVRAREPVVVRWRAATGGCGTWRRASVPRCWHVLSVRTCCEHQEDR